MKCEGARFQGNLIEDPSILSDGSFDFNSVIPIPGIELDPAAIPDVTIDPLASNAPGYVRLTGAARSSVSSRFNPAVNLYDNIGSGFKSTNGDLFYIVDVLIGRDNRFYYLADKRKPIAAHTKEGFLSGLDADVDYTLVPVSDLYKSVAGNLELAVPAFVTGSKKEQEELYALSTLSPEESKYLTQQEFKFKIKDLAVTANNALTNLMTSLGIEGSPLRLLNIIKQKFGDNFKEQEARDVVIKFIDDLSNHVQSIKSGISNAEDVSADLENLRTFLYINGASFYTAALDRETNAFINRIKMHLAGDTSVIPEAKSELDLNLQDTYDEVRKFFSRLLDALDKETHLKQKFNLPALDTPEGIIALAKDAVRRFNDVRVTKYVALQFSLYNILALVRGSGEIIAPTFSTKSESRGEGKLKESIKVDTLTKIQYIDKYKVLAPYIDGVARLDILRGIASDINEVLSAGENRKYAMKDLIHKLIYDSYDKLLPLYVDAINKHNALVAAGTISGKEINVGEAIQELGANILFQSSPRARVEAPKEEATKEEVEAAVKPPDIISALRAATKTGQKAHEEAGFLSPDLRSIIYAQENNNLDEFNATVSEHEAISYAISSESHKIGFRPSRWSIPRWEEYSRFLNQADSGSYNEFIDAVSRLSDKLSPIAPDIKAINSKYDELLNAVLATTRGEQVDSSFAAEATALVNSIDVEPKDQERTLITFIKRLRTIDTLRYLLNIPEYKQSLILLRGLLDKAKEFTKQKDLPQVTARALGYLTGDEFNPSELGIPSFTVNGRAITSERDIDQLKVKLDDARAKLFSFTKEEPEVPVLEKAPIEPLTSLQPPVEALTPEETAAINNSEPFTDAETPNEEVVVTGPVLVAAPIPTTKTQADSPAVMLPEAPAPEAATIQKAVEGDEIAIKELEHNPAPIAQTRKDGIKHGKARKNDLSQGIIADTSIVPTGTTEHGKPVATPEDLAARVPHAPILDINSLLTNRGISANIPEDGQSVILQPTTETGIQELDRAVGGLPSTAGVAVVEGGVQVPTPLLVPIATHLNNEESYIVGSVLDDPSVAADVALRSIFLENGTDIDGVSNDELEEALKKVQGDTQAGTRAHRVVTKEGTVGYDTGELGGVLPTRLKQNGDGGTVEVIDLSRIIEPSFTDPLDEDFKEHYRSVGRSKGIGDNILEKQLGAIGRMVARFLAGDRGHINISGTGAGKTSMTYRVLKWIKNYVDVQSNNKNAKTIIVVRNRELLRQWVSELMNKLSDAEDRKWLIENLKWASTKPAVGGGAMHLGPGRPEGRMRGYSKVNENLARAEKEYARMEEVANEAYHKYNNKGIRIKEEVGQDGTMHYSIVGIKDKVGSVYPVQFQSKLNTKKSKLEGLRAEAARKKTTGSLPGDYETIYQEAVADVTGNTSYPYLKPLELKDHGGGLYFITEDILKGPDSLTAARNQRLELEGREEEDLKDEEREKIDKEIESEIDLNEWARKQGKKAFEKELKKYGIFEDVQRLEKEKGAALTQADIENLWTERLISIFGKDLVSIAYDECQGAANYLPPEIFARDDGSINGLTTDELKTSGINFNIDRDESVLFTQDNNHRVSVVNPKYQAKLALRFLELSKISRFALGVSATPLDIIPKQMMYLFSMLYGKVDKNLFNVLVKAFDIQTDIEQIWENRAKNGIRDHDINAEVPKEMGSTIYGPVLSSKYKNNENNYAVLAAILKQNGFMTDISITLPHKNHQIRLKVEPAYVDERASVSRLRSYLMGDPRNPKDNGFCAKLDTALNLPTGSARNFAGTLLFLLEARYLEAAKISPVADFIKSVMDYHSKGASRAIPKFINFFGYKSPSSDTASLDAISVLLKTKGINYGAKYGDFRGTGELINETTRWAIDYARIRKELLTSLKLIDRIETQAFTLAYLLKAANTSKGVHSIKRSSLAAPVPAISGALSLGDYIKQVLKLGRDEADQFELKVPRDKIPTLIGILSKAKEYYDEEGKKLKTEYRSRVGTGEELSALVSNLEAGISVQDICENLGIEQRDFIKVAVRAIIAKELGEHNLKIPSPMVEMRRNLIARGIDPYLICEKHGDQSDSLSDFSDGKKQILNSTLDSIATGYNLQDTTGNAPRYVNFIGIPATATRFLQATGRAYRPGLRSDVYTVVPIVGTQFEYSRLGAIAHKALAGANLRGKDVSVDELFGVLRSLSLTSPEPESTGATSFVPSEPVDKPSAVAMPDLDAAVPAVSVVARPEASEVAQGASVVARPEASEAAPVVARPEASEAAQGVPAAAWGILQYKDHTKFVPFEYKVLNLDDVIQSNLSDGSINPEYEEVIQQLGVELQPREKLTSGSRAFLDELTYNYNPAKVVNPSSDTDVGPPVVFEVKRANGQSAYVVVAGHTRTIATKALLERRPGFAPYMDYLHDSLKTTYGISGQEYERPFLARVIDYDPEVAPDIANYSNSGDLLPMQQSEAVGALASMISIRDIIGAYSSTDPLEYLGERIPSTEGPAFKSGGALSFQGRNFIYDVVLKKLNTMSLPFDSPVQITSRPSVYTNTEAFVQAAVGFLNGRYSANYLLKGKLTAGRAILPVVLDDFIVHNPKALVDKAITYAAKESAHIRSVDPFGAYFSLPNSTKRKYINNYFSYLEDSFSTAQQDLLGEPVKSPRELLKKVMPDKEWKLLAPTESVVRQILVGSITRFGYYVKLFDNNFKASPEIEKIYKSGRDLNAGLSLNSDYVKNNLFKAIFAFVAQNYPEYVNDSELYSLVKKFRIQDLSGFGDISLGSSSVETVHRAAKQALGPNSSIFNRYVGYKVYDPAIYDTYTNDATLENFQKRYGAIILPKQLRAVVQNDNRTNYNTQLALVRRGTVRTSHILEAVDPKRGISLVTNPNYSEVFQPRDRASVVSVGQLARMLSSPNMRAFTEVSSYADRGIPIVDTTGAVLSGNGRMIALRRLLETRPVLASEYYGKIAEYLSSIGVQPPEDLKNYELVRVLVPDPSISVDNIIRFTVLANTKPVLASTPVEVASSINMDMSLDRNVAFLATYLSPKGANVDALTEGFDATLREVFRKSVDEEAHSDLALAIGLRNLYGLEAFRALSSLFVDSTVNDNIKNAAIKLIVDKPDSALSLFPLFISLADANRIRSDKAVVHKVVNADGVYQYNKTYPRAFSFSSVTPYSLALGLFKKDPIDGAVGIAMSQLAGILSLDKVEADNSLTVNSAQDLYQYIISKYLEDVAGEDAISEPLKKLTGKQLEDAINSGARTGTASIINYFTSKDTKLKRLANKLVQYFTPPKATKFNKSLDIGYNGIELSVAQNIGTYYKESFAELMDPLGALFVKAFIPETNISRFESILLPFSLDMPTISIIERDNCLYAGCIYKNTLSLTGIVDHDEIYMLRNIAPYTLGKSIFFGEAIENGVSIMPFSKIRLILKAGDVETLSAQQVQNQFKSSFDNGERTAGSNPTPSKDKPEQDSSDAEFKQLMSTPVKLLFGGFGAGA